jgi:hypothetical protein
VLVNVRRVEHRAAAGRGISGLVEVLAFIPDKRPQVPFATQLLHSLARKLMPNGYVFRFTVGTHHWRAQITKNALTSPRDGGLRRRLQPEDGDFPLITDLA